MGHAGHDRGLEIGKNRLDRLWRLGRRLGQGGQDRTGGRLRTHGAVAQSGVVIAGPIGGAAAPVTKILPVHMLPFVRCC